MRRIVLFILLVASSAYLYLVRMTPDLMALEVGQPAPQFSLTTYDGEVVSLESLKGKIVVLEWFNKGCPFVQKHYKSGHMQAIQKEYSELGVKWIIVNSTNPEHRDFLTPQAAADLTKEWKIESAQITRDESGAVGKLYGAKTTPHMFVIDEGGKLIYQGAIDNAADYDSDPKDAKNYVAAALDKSIYGKGSEFVKETDPYGCSIKY